MITLPTIVTDMLEAGRLSLRTLIRFELDSGPTGLWNDTFPVTTGGCNYTGIGGNIEVGQIGGQEGLSSEGVEITISGLAPAARTVLDGIAWHQRPVVVYDGYLDDAGNVLHVEAAFSGFMDALVEQDAAGETFSLRLTVEGNNRELSRSNGRTRSDSDQRQINATDGFFKHAANATVDVEITWGRKGPQYPVKLR